MFRVDARAATPLKPNSATENASIPAVVSSIPFAPRARRHSQVSGAVSHIAISQRVGSSTFVETSNRTANALRAGAKRPNTTF